MFDIEETLNKVRQLGGLKRFRPDQSDADKRRILQKHCDRIGICPVTAGELD